MSVPAMALGRPRGADRVTFAVVQTGTDVAHAVSPITLLCGATARCGQLDENASSHHDRSCLQVESR